jgi:pyruvate,water dikinase
LPKESFDPLLIWFSFGAFQGLLSAITPLGQDMLRMFFSSAGKMFGAQIRYDETDVLRPAGERLWIKISDVIRHPLGRRIYKSVLGFGEPSVGQILRGLEEEPHLGAGQGHMKFSTLRALLGFALPILPRAAGTIHDPDKTRSDFTAYVESQLVRPNITGDDKYTRLAQRLQFMQEHAAAGLYKMFPRFVPVLGPTLASLALLSRITKNQNDAQTDHGFSTTVLEVTRGLPNNVTTEMDLALWRMANDIRADSDSLKIFLASDASTLASRYLTRTLPEAAQQALENFMAQYGMRGIGEIDLGQPRWREEPASIMQTLQSYLQITPEMAPDVLFQRGAKASDAAIEQLALAARRQNGGRLRERIVRGAARRIRTLMGLRESPKFFLVRMLGIVRSELLASGEEFAREGIIEKPEDLFFLHFSELKELANNTTRDWKALIAERRSTHERENRRRQIPRVLVSDGRAFYEGIGVLDNTDDVISGSPVSPGVAEGIVRVILDPRQSQLAPGEILVCPGTDPAWTPLFMAAGGLITEVGGMMTHGSVVAREYGIPAVVGVHQATTRLKDGQRVRIDGTAGKIIVLE